LFAIVIGVPAATAGPIAQEFQLARFTVDSGGVIRSTGGDFEVSGTIGQPDAGVLTGGNFELTGGFWFELAATDCNDDGAVNLLDHGSFTDCLTGPGSAMLTGCDCYDVNQDRAVDLHDFAEGQNLFSIGSGH
jgi:hypothetical protein